MQSCRRTQINAFHKNWKSCRFTDRTMMSEQNRPPARPPVIIHRSVARKAGVGHAAAAATPARLELSTSEGRIAVLELLHRAHPAAARAAASPVSPVKARYGRDI